MSNPIRERTKELFPTVLLTLTSIVQAVALELLWSKIVSSPALIVWSPASLGAWLQVAATFVGILLVWVIYANNVMRFRWVPDTGDTIVPLSVGLMEFSLVHWIGNGTVGLWLIVLGLIFAVMVWASHAMMKRAREEPENVAFFAGRGRATWRDFTGSIMAICLLLSAGIVISVTDYAGGWNVVVLAGCLALLLWQLWGAHVFWRQSMIQTAAPRGLREEDGGQQSG